MKIEISFEEQVKVLKDTLVQLQDDLEEVGSSFSDLEVWDAINVVLNYICTEEELEEIESRKVNPNFLKNYLTTLGIYSGKD